MLWSTNHDKGVTLEPLLISFELVDDFFWELLLLCTGSGVTRLLTGEVGNLEAIGVASDPLESSYEHCKSDF